MSPTKFAACTHEVGEPMWTGITPQTDGSYWGLHQWFFDTASCTPNPILGPTAWRVLETAAGKRLLRVCLSEPGSREQPTIAPDGEGSDATFGCIDSALISSLPKDAFSSYAEVPSDSGCLLRGKLRIRIRNSQSDPLRKITIMLKSGGVHKAVKARPRGHGYVATLNFRGLPEAPVTVTVKLTTVLGRHLSGRRTYARCKKTAPPTDR